MLSQGYILTQIKPSSNDCYNMLGANRFLFVYSFPLSQAGEAAPFPQYIIRSKENFPSPFVPESSRFSHSNLGPGTAGSLSAGPELLPDGASLAAGIAYPCSRRRGAARAWPHKPPLHALSSCRAPPHLQMLRELGSPGR